MTVAPPLTLPQRGLPITPNAAFAYVKRESSVRQAAYWNAALADDPVFGPASGFVVGVGSRVGRRWPLVWIGPSAEPQADLELVTVGAR